MGESRKGVGERIFRNRNSESKRRVVRQDEGEKREQERVKGMEIVLNSLVDDDFCCRACGIIMIVSLPPGNGCLPTRSNLWGWTQTTT